MGTNSCIDELLRRGVADWVDASEVAWVAKSVGGVTGMKDVRELSIRLLRELLDRRLIDVGMVTETGFTAWEVPVDEALEWIECEWLALPKGPDLGDIFWLNLTDKGAVNAADLLSKVDSS